MTMTGSTSRAAANLLNVDKSLIENAPRIYHPGLGPDEMAVKLPWSTEFIKIPGIRMVESKDYWLTANEDPNFDWTKACHPGTDFSKDGPRKPKGLRELTYEDKLGADTRWAHTEARNVHEDILNECVTCLKPFMDFTRVEVDEEFPFADLLRTYFLAQLVAEIALADIVRRFVREKKVQMQYWYLTVLEYALSNCAAIKWFLKRECAPIANKKRKWNSKDCFIVPMAEACVKNINTNLQQPDLAWDYSLKLSMRVLIIFRKLVPFTKYSQPLISFLKSYTAFDDMVIRINDFLRKNPHRKSHDATPQLCMIKRLIYLLNDVLDKVTTKSYEYGPDQMEHVVRLTNVGGLYMVFCSSPMCSKFCDRNKVFMHCGQCQLSRYCSRECQSFHWRNGHRESCLKLKRKV